jgi:hypothetical protein
MHSRAWAARVPMQASHDSTVPLGIQPIGLCFVFLFSEKIQIQANFKILY